MKAKDIMCKNIYYAAFNDSFIRCASILKENNIGFLPIEKEGKLVGVITDRDLCIRGFTEENNINNPVENIMTRQFMVVDENDKIDDIFEVMKTYRIKRLLVHANKKIVGVISFSDILATLDTTDPFVTVLKQIYQLDQLKSIEEPKVDEFYL